MSINGVFSRTLAIFMFSCANEDSGVYHVCHVIYHLCKDASSKFTGKSEIFSDFYFFPTHPYENLNALWHWELQSGTAVTSKMVWTLFSASRDRERLVYWHNAKSPARKMGLGGLGRHRGKKVVPSTASRDGGNESGRRKSTSDAFKTQTVHEKLSSPSELRTHVKQANAKKPVVIYWKVTFTCVVPGW